MEEADDLQSHGKILVMDDEERIRDVVSRMLEEIGYQIVCAKDGREAIQAYQGLLSSGGN